MKNSIGWKTVPLLAAAMLLSGCDEKYGVTTVIGRDGSCDRIITLSRSSRDLSTSGFPLPLDPSWETAWKEPEKKGENATFTARKHFPHFDSLAAAYARYNEPERLRIRPRFGTKFRWFYTYYHYEETYERFDSFQALPPSAMMSEDEIRRFVAGEPSDSLRTKVKDWESRNGFEFIYQRLRAAAGTLHDANLSDALLSAKKEEMYQVLMSDTATSGRKAKGKDTTMAGEAIELLSEVLPSPPLRKLRQPIEEIAQEWLRRSEVSATIQGEYTNTVVMPGVILSTNATEVKGSSAAWNFSDDQLHLTDYTMHAESRTINTWSFYVTGGLFLLLVGSPVAIRYGRRHR